MAGRRDGFWQEYTAAIVLAVVIGAAAAAGIAAGLDGAFARVAADVLGPADESTFVVHVRADLARAAADRIGPLLERLEDELEASGLGPVPPLRARSTAKVPGNANFLIPVPEELLTDDALARLPELMEQLPGFNGYTWLLEPSVTVAAPEAAVRDAVAAEAANLEGVRAVVGHGSRATLVVEDEAARGRVARHLESWLDARQIVAVRWAEDASPGVGPRVLYGLERSLPPGSWRTLTAEAEEAPWGPLVAALETLPDAWENLTVAGVRAEEGLRRTIALLDGLEPLLAASEGPEAQGEFLARLLRGDDDGPPVKDALLGVAASLLWQRLSADAAPARTKAAASAPSDRWEQWKQARETLVAAADGAARLSALAGEDGEEVAAALRRVHDLLPAGPGRGGPGVTLLVEGSFPASELEAAVAAWLDDEPSVHVFTAPAGVVEPSPRALLADLLEDVRRAVAGIVALLLAGGFLVLDHSAVFAAWPRLAEAGVGAAGRAALVGAVLFAGTYGLAGGGVAGVFSAVGPGIDVLFVALSGAGAGLLTYRWAPRLSPVDEAEVLAGRSLGLDDGQLLREIVVPAGRPGPLTFLNRFRRRFP